jgi:hypothetical protein
MTVDVAIEDGMAIPTFDGLNEIHQHRSISFVRG